MAERFEVSGVDDETAHPLNLLSLMERVTGIVTEVQACQQRMEERQLELESNVKNIQEEVLKLAKDHSTTSSTVEKLLEKTRKVGANIKDVRVRLEKQNLRVKKVETTQGELLTKNKFRVVIYQGDNEVPAVPAAKTSKGDLEEDDDAIPPPAELSSDEEYMVVEEADSSTAGRLKKTGLKRFESIKATFSKENMAKTKENLGTKVNRLGDRIVTAERREKIRQSGERLKQSGERLRESISKNVPAKLKKERTVAEGQEGAEGTTEAAPPVPPPKGRKTNPDVTYTDVLAKDQAEGPKSELADAQKANDSKIQFGSEGKREEAEVPMYDMKQLS